MKSRLLILIGIVILGISILGGLSLMDSESIEKGKKLIPIIEPESQK